MYPYFRLFAIKLGGGVILYVLHFFIILVITIIPTLNILGSIATTRNCNII